MTYPPTSARTVLSVRLGADVAAGRPRRGESVVQAVAVECQRMFHVAIRSGDEPPSDMDMHNTIRPVGVLRSVELRPVEVQKATLGALLGRALEQNAHSGRDTAGRKACAQDRHERGGVIVPAGTPPRDVTNERSRRQARQTQAFAAQVRLVGVTSFGRERGKVPTNPRPDPRPDCTSARKP
jgi:hypothetical protein